MRLEGSSWGYLDPGPGSGSGFGSGFDSGCSMPKHLSTSGISMTLSTPSYVSIDFGLHEFLLFPIAQLLNVCPKIWDARVRGNQKSVYLYSSIQKKTYSKPCIF